MGVPAAQAPDGGDALYYAYEVAFALTNVDLAAINPMIYRLAVYNLGGDNLINWAPDVGTATPPTYWSDLRKNYGCNDFVAGVVSSSSDESTSSSQEVIAQLKDLSIGQLQNLKTPYGRQYLAFAAQFGSLWGIS